MAKRAGRQCHRLALLLILRVGTQEASAQPSIVWSITCGSDGSLRMKYLAVNTSCHVKPFVLEICYFSEEADDALTCFVARFRRISCPSHVCTRKIDDVLHVAPV